MGLLQKAMEQVIKKEGLAEKVKKQAVKTHGIVGEKDFFMLEKEESRGEGGEESPTGLLARALHFRTLIEREPVKKEKTAEEISGEEAKGLLARAKSLRHEFRGEISYGRQSLLKRALKLAMEKKEENVEPSSLFVEEKPGQLEPGVVPEEEIKVKGKGYFEEKAVIPEEVTEAKETKIIKPLPEPLTGKEIAGGGIETIPLTRMLERDDILGIVDRCNSTFTEGGVSKLSQLVLEAVTIISAGRIGVLYQVSGKRLSLKAVYSTNKKAPLAKSFSIRKGETFLSLFNSYEMPIASNKLSKSGATNLPETLKQIEPWIAFPFGQEKRPDGLFIVGPCADAEIRVPDTLILLIRLYGFYAARERLERDLKKQKRQRERINTLHQQITTLLEKVRNKFGGVQDLFKSVCEQYGIEMALLVGEWDRNPRIISAVGLSEESINSYRFIKQKSKINKVCKKSIPALIDNLPLKAMGLAGEDLEHANSFIVVPILFAGNAIGVILIHRMKGVSRRLSKEALSSLNFISASLVPPLLDDRLKRVDPYGIITEHIHNTVTRANRLKTGFCCLLVEMKNSLTYFEKVGYVKYEGFRVKVSTMLEAVAGTEGRVIFIDASHLVIIIWNVDDVKIAEISGEIVKGFNKIKNKMKKTETLEIEILSCRYPEDISTEADFFRLFEHQIMKGR